MASHTHGKRLSPDQLDPDSTSANATIARLINKEIRPHARRRLRAVENFIVLWFDPSIDESKKSVQRFINDLRQVVNAIETFVHTDRCLAYLNEVKEEKVFLVVSASVNSQFVSAMSTKKQLASVYIFRQKNEEQPEWTDEFPKVIGVFGEAQALCDRLKADVRQQENNFASFSIINSCTSTNRNELNSSFMYSQLLKEILLGEKTTQRKKKEFVEFCRANYSGNERELETIDEFDQNYPKPSLIWWYTRECFLYLMLNKALRTQDVEMIMKMGFILRDLHQNIEQLHAEQKVQESLTVYRGQGLKEIELERIKKSEGGLLAFNSFLSTSKTEKIAKGFTSIDRSSTDLAAIVFRIHIDPKISTTPFVHVDESGWYGDREKEVLFSMHTVFRIGETTKLDSGHYQVDLYLTKDNDEQLAQLTEYLRQATQGPTGMHRMGQLMCHMGEFKKAKQIYTTLIEITPEQDRQQRALFHHQLGFISKQKNDLASALMHYQESLDIKVTYLDSADPQLSPTYSNIGSVLHDQGDLDGALEHLKYALKVDLGASTPNRLGIAIRYNNIGSVLEDMGNHHEALINYQRALDLQRSELPELHPSVATTYNNIGLAHRRMGDNTSALQYYQKTLDIFQRSLPPEHISLATCHHNMAMVLTALRRITEAVSHAQQAVAIAQHSYDVDDPEVQRRRAYLEEIRQSL